MPYLCPQTLTTNEQRLILRFIAKHPRDNLIFSMAIGTGLRLSELIGLNVGDVFAADVKPKTRVWIRREIARRDCTCIRESTCSSGSAGPAAGGSQVTWWRSDEHLTYWCENTDPPV